MEKGFFELRVDKLYNDTDGTAYESHVHCENMDGMHVMECVGEGLARFIANDADMMLKLLHVLLRNEEIRKNILSEILRK